MKKHLGDGTIEISGQDLANLTHVVHEAEVLSLGQAAARRVEAARLKQSGLSWSKARKAAVNAQPTPEMLKVIRERLGHGWNFTQVIAAATAAAGMQEVK